MSDTIYAFLDTNVFIHYKLPTQVDWCSFLKVKQVTLVVCLPVIQELDRKKSDTRLSDRAMKATREIRNYETPSKALRPGVFMDIYNEPFRRNLFPDSLDPDSQDDRIVQLALSYARTHPDREVCIVTEDYNMELRCRAGGVRVETMEPSCRLENPGDEKDKKLKLVQSELANYKNRTPTLSIYASASGQDFAPDRPFSCLLPADWVELDVQSQIEKKRKEYPKHCDMKSSPFGELANDAALRLIDPNAWKNYDLKVDAYLADYARYIESLNEWGVFNSRIVQFDLWLVNDGKSPASDIDCRFNFLPRIFNLGQTNPDDPDEVEMLAKPVAPKPPELPSLGAASRLSSFPAVVHAERSLAPWTIEARAIGGPNVSISKTIQGGITAHAKLSRLKHGEKIVLSSFLAVFGEREAAGPLQVEYAITATELLDATIGKLPLIVNKAEPTSTTGWPC